MASNSWIIFFIIFSFFSVSCSNVYIQFSPNISLDLRTRWTSESKKSYMIYIIIKYKIQMQSESRQNVQLRNSLLTKKDVNFELLLYLVRNSYLHVIHYELIGYPRTIQFLDYNCHHLLRCQVGRKCYREPKQNIRKTLLLSLNVILHNLQIKDIFNIFGINYELKLFEPSGVKTWRSFEVRILTAEVVKG